jgi:phosphatidylserine/phosphatidylglycerophosphate/cardiolipin synthase-like enzyme
VHSKVCIIDDVWMIVGSDNLNIRSWTNDSELSCAVIDRDRDEREPADPANLGDGARVLARETRLALWREHLGRSDGDDDDLLDGLTAIGVLRRAAAQLDSWRVHPGSSPRPAGRLRLHDPEPVRSWATSWVQFMYHALIDPDGRPRRLARAGEF